MTSKIQPCKHDPVYCTSLLKPTTKWYWMCTKCGETGLTTIEPKDVDEALYARTATRYVRGSRK